MPAAKATFADVEPFLRNIPEWTENEGSYGNVYTYRLKAADFTKPFVGDLWADGALLTDVKTSDVPNARGAIYDLTVSTVTSSTQGGSTITTKVESETKYELAWGRSQKKLVQHAAFMPDGTYDLFKEVSGKTGHEDVLGWEMEQNSALKQDYKYRALDSNGIASTTTTTITNPSVKVYCVLRRLGYDIVPVPFPIWRETTVWRGTKTPDLEVAGQYIQKPETIPKLPSDLRKKYPYWIQSETPAERIQGVSRWRVIREWTGSTELYFDVDTIFKSVEALI